MNSDKRKKNEQERMMARVGLGAGALALLAVLGTIGVRLCSAIDKSSGECPVVISTVSGLTENSEMAGADALGEGSEMTSNQILQDSTENSRVSSEEATKAPEESSVNTSAPSEEPARAPEESSENAQVPSEEPAKTPQENPSPSLEPAEAVVQESVPNPGATTETYSWNDQWQYAGFSAIHEDTVTLYRSTSENRKGIVVGINAGHGTSGGNKVRTQCHPDGSEKVTGGSTAAGSTTAAAVSGGTTFLDGTPEATATLSLAILCKQYLLEEGYDVLMIRESSDCRLDNIARTVFANQYANCHIAIHYDSSDSDKGFFYIGVPDIASYKAMEPVASHWQQHNSLGASLLEGMKTQGVKINGKGSMALDLTQTSYSTVPSIDVEVGDRGSDYSEKTQKEIAMGLVKGVNNYFGQ